LFLNRFPTTNLESRDGGIFPPRAIAPPTINFAHPIGRAKRKRAIAPPPLTRTQSPSLLVALIHNQEVSTNINYGGKFMSQQNPEKVFLRIAEICHRYGVSVPSVHRWVKSGKFPKPKKISRCSVWNIKDLEAFEDSLDS